MKPTVTIIIPCYNQASFLPRAIASLQAQTLEDWECIIVDDGSTDNTAEVASNMALHDPRVRLFQKLNGGSAGARDMGLRNATGEYIQFLDADDTIAPLKLEKQAALMNATQSDISYTAFCTEEKDGTRTSPRFVSLSLTRIMLSWGIGASVPVHSFLYRTEFIRSHKLTFKSNCRFRKDWRWHMLCFGAHPKVTELPDYCGAVYYQNEQGKTGSYIKMQEGNFIFMASMIPLLKGGMKMLWALRISEELWIWLLRMCKYRSTEVMGTIRHLFITTGSTLLLAAAILLMPLSCWGVIIYFIRIYLAK